MFPYVLVKELKFWVRNYQLAQSSLKIAFVLAEKNWDRGRWVGILNTCPCTWYLPWLAVERPWLSLLTLLIQTGVEITLLPCRSTISGYCRQFGWVECWLVGVPWPLKAHWWVSVVKAMNPQDCLKEFWLYVAIHNLSKTCSEWSTVVKVIDLVSNWTVILMLAWPKLTRGILLL